MKRFVALSLVFAAAVAGCKKDAKIEPPDEPGNGSPAQTMRVQVVVPSGTAFNPAGNKILSGASYADIDGGGYAQAATDTSGSGVTIAYVFNKEEKLVLAGFINDTIKVISPASTAKVLLYWGLKFPFLPAEVTKAYVNNAEKIQSARDWITKFEALYKADPLVIAKGAFKTDLKIAIEKIRDSRNINVNGKTASDVQVDANDVKSGIQVLEDGLSKVSVNNYYRRRAHGYLYKMRYKDQNGAVKHVLQKITEVSNADKDFPVDPVSAVTSVLGEIGKYVETRGQDNATQSFVVKSGPVDVSLGDNETEATYKLRVIGPGKTETFLTNTEKIVMDRLMFEMFIYDVAIPAYATALSIKGLAAKPKLPEKAYEPYLETIKGMYKSMPDVHEEVKKGNYENALNKLIENFHKDLQGASLNMFCTFLGKIYEMDPKSVLQGGLAKLANIMAAFDIALATSDLYRIMQDGKASNYADEWEVIARGSKVSLDPAESAVVISDQKKLSATIKNLNAEPGTHPYFIWTTSGKYGYLKDTKGNQGASLESPDKDIFYNCNARSSDLGDGDNWEYVYVKAYYKNELIGTDTAKINVRKLKYKIIPNNITLSGKNNGLKSHNSVTFNLLRSDNVKDIKPNAALDYKIVWSTPGKHGVLSNSQTQGTTATTYDDNTMTYECTDDKTKESKETITARIYVKAKDAENYHLLDEVTTTVNIDNDDKKKIIEVSMTYLPGCWGPGNCYVHPVAIVPVEDSAKRYKVMFYNFTGTYTGQVEGSTFTWNKGQRPNTTYSTYPPQDIQGGSYYVSFGRTWCAGPESGCNMGSTAEWIARYKEMYGNSVRVEVTYYY